ncbi:hypothetical protein A2U01_0067403, partial [Trifolium medium]|nr:hypothetical protein [Trifolium medium]
STSLIASSKAITSPSTIEHFPSLHPLPVFANLRPAAAAAAALLCDYPAVHVAAVPISIHPIDAAF